MIESEKMMMKKKPLKMMGGMMFGLKNSLKALKMMILPCQIMAIQI